MKYNFPEYFFFKVSNKLLENFIQSHFSFSTKVMAENQKKSKNPSENKGVELAISVFDKNTKNKQYTLPYNLQYKSSLQNYIFKCFDYKPESSLILYQKANPPGKQEILGNNVFYKDIENIEKYIFHVYLFPNPSHKSLFLDFINEQKDPEVYFYAVLQGKGVKEKALDLTQPNKGNSNFDLDKYVENAKDLHNILFAYNQFINQNTDNPLSPYQYLVYNGLRKDLFENDNVKQFIENYDSPYKYHKKVYEYYKFRLSQSEYAIVDSLLSKYCGGIKLETDDGDADDSNNDIIKKKEFVLNTFMAASKNEELTRIALEVWFNKDL